MVKIGEIILFITEYNAIKLPGRESAFSAAFCYRFASEIIQQERKGNQVKQFCLKWCQQLQCYYFLFSIIHHPA